jgi:hypothetical protein
MLIGCTFALLLKQPLPVLILVLRNYKAVIRKKVYK